VVDVRTDVYALGVVFYECVTGHKPFVAEEVTALSVLIYTGQCRPVRELRPDVPEGLARVIARAMAGKREDRYPSAAALAEAIREPIVAGTGAQVWPPVRVRVRSSLNPPKETQRSPAPPPGSHDADLALGPTVQATGTERPPAPSPPGSGSTSIAGAVSMDRPLGASAAPSGPTRRGWMLAAVALLALGAAAAVGARLTRSTREIAPAPAAVVPAVQATPSAESIALQPAPSASSAPVQRVTARTPPPSASSAASLAAPASSKPSPKSRAKELGLRTDNPFAE
jgi:serine/threonine-protein kinase